MTALSLAFFWSADGYSGALAAPIADFEWEPAPAVAGLPVQFTDTSMVSPGAIVSWEWDFDDDGTPDSTVQNPQFVFATAGVYPVSLSVADDAANSVEVARNVTVVDPPAVSFEYTPESPVVFGLTQFTDTSLDDGSIVSWEWDFEDDGFVDSTEQHPIHQFLSIGTHNVRLTVIDDEGNSGSGTGPVLVGPGGAPAVDFTFTPNPPIIGDPTRFVDLSTDPDNDIDSWEWDFGNDGVVDSTDQNPERTLDGPTDVNLRVTDRAGNVGEFTRTGITPRSGGGFSQSTILLSDCDFGLHRRVYFANETVCVSGTVRTHAGGGIFPSADIYITENRSWSAGDNLTGLDVTGLFGSNPNTVIGFYGAGAYFDEILWLPLLTAGDYDIVIDEDRDGFYAADPDNNFDSVVGLGSSFAIRVVPAPLGAFVPDIAEIKLDAADEIERWEGIKLHFKIIGYIKTILDAAGNLANPGGQLGKGLAAVTVGAGISTNEDIKPIPLDYNDAVLYVSGKIINGIADQMASKYTALAFDPLDPDYQVLVPLDITPEVDLHRAIREAHGLSVDYPFPPVGSTPLEAASQEVIALLSEQAAIIDALIASHEKYLGAQAEDDLEWAVLHANGMQLYAQMLEENLLATRTATEALRAEIVALPLGSQVVDVESMRQFKDRVAEVGFKDSEIADFREAGYSDAEIAEFLSEMLNLDIPAAPFTATDSVDAMIDAQDLILTSTQGLAASAAGLKADLEFFVWDIADPLADAGGPYSGTVGSPLVVDGSASVANATSLTYEWDLDLDGEFDDATGPTASPVFTTPGVRLIGLSVTNDLGLTDFDYTTVDMTLGNAAPLVTSFAPTELGPVLEFGDTLSFSVAATDPDGDPLSFSWELNGIAAGTGGFFDFTPDAGDFGSNLVRVIVSDNDPFSPNAIEQRIVSVVFPDADGDEFRSNVDCNDGDSSINPGVPETVGDGLDNDCDPATPDSGQGPVAAFVTEPIVPLFGGLTQFGDLSDDANDDIVSWEWDFGDGNTSTEQNPTHTFATGGTLTVSLTVADTQANSDTATRDFTILTPPTAGFVYTPDPANVSEPVQFTDTSTDPDSSIVDWKWDFDDDGNFDSSLQNPIFTYGSKGDFPVTLRVTDEHGNSDTFLSVVVVAEAPIADFTVTPDSPIIAVDAQLTDTSTDDESIVQWEWDFEDDGVVDSTLQNPVHQFLTGGTNPVRLTVTDNVGAVGTVVKLVVVDVGDPPEPFFSFDPSIVVAGEVVHFTDESTDPDNQIVRWEWDFQADGVIDSEDQHPTHIYPTFGSTNIFLRVTDQAGNQGELTIASVPVRARPAASFTTSDLTPALGQTVTFTSTSTDADSPISKYLWDFGDGETGKGSEVTHEFNSGGTFDIILTVVDIHSLSDSATQQVSVVNVGAPTADFSYSPLAPVVGETVNLFDESTDDSSVVSWEWDFDENGLPDSTDQDPTTVFNVQGTFTVTLIVTDDEANTDSVTRDIVVGLGDPPVADFDFVPAPPLVGESTFFTDLSTDSDNAVVSWDWDFGDGGSSSLRNPSHVFSSPGTVDITLTVTDEAGNGDTLTIVGIPVLARPVAEFSFTPVGSLPITAGDSVQFTDESTDADNAIASYEWDFGDGDTDTAPDPVHSFSAGGTFDVMLTVTDTTGLSSSVTHQVVVLAGESPTADFTYTPLDPAPNENIHFTDQSTDDGSMVQWEWDFEDDGTVDSMVQNPTHSFPTGGDFDVRLTVEDNIGNSDSTVQTISVPTKPLALIGTSKDRNLARSVDGAIAISATSVASSNPPSAAIDNQPNTVWQTPTGQNTDQHIEVELVGLSLHSVESIFIEGSSQTNAVMDFEFQVSTTGHDESDFTTVLTGTAPNDNVGAEFVLTTPVDARFVRLNALNNYGHSSMRVDQFEVRDGVGTNVALFQGDGVGAQIVGYSSIVSSNHPVGAIDENGNSAWVTQSGFATDESIVIDLIGDLQLIDRIFVEGHSGSDAVKDFEVLVSTTGTEAGDFTSVFTGASPRSVLGQTFYFPQTVARYVQFRMINNHGHPNQIRLDTVEFYSPERDGGIVSLRNGPTSTAWATSEQSNFFAQNAIDTNENSFWRSTGKVGESLTVKLGGARLYMVDRFQVRSNSVADAVEDFEVQVSTTTADDSEFSTVFNGTGAATTATQEFTFPPVQARYVRILVNTIIDNANNNNCCVRINTFHVYDVDERRVSRTDFVGAFIADESSRANDSSQPLLAIDFSTASSWTTASGDTENQWFKVTLLENEEPGDLHVIDRVHVRGTSSTNAIKDFEVRVSTVGIADPATSDDATRLNDPNFTTVLTGSLPQDNSFHWFEFPPVEARFVQFVALNTHNPAATNMAMNSFRVFAASRGGADVPFMDRSSDPDGSIVSWDWDFGDGTGSTEQFPRHQYESTGTYTVTLTVTDNDGFSDMAMMEYSVLHKPTAAYAQDIAEPNEGQFVRFDDVSTSPFGDPELTRSFEFSTGTSTTNNAVNIQFNDNGEYTVDLEVMDYQFMHDTLHATISVANVPPNFALTDDVTSPWGYNIRAFGTGVLSDASGDTSTLLCEVDWGDGSPLLTVQGCSGFDLFTSLHPYATPGVYTISIVVTDKEGAWTSDTRTVTITKRESHVTIWGADALSPPDGGGEVTAFARLVDFDQADRHDPLAGKTITFSLGGVTQDVITDINGEAQATFTYVPGQTDLINADFAGDVHYDPSRDRPFAFGDVFLGVGAGIVHRHDPDGVYINAFDTRTNSNETAGMCFDSNGNLFTTNFNDHSMSKFDRTTGVTTPRWASGFSTFPESCVITRENIDADPELEDVLFAGEVDGQNNLRKFGPDGTLLQQFDVVFRDRGLDWLDLASDQRTLFYTTEGDDILRYDVVDDIQLPDFVPDQTVEANQIVPVPERLPENAIDDDVNSIWQTHIGDIANQFIVVDLIGETQTIDSVFIEAHTLNTAVRNFEIQVSTSGIEDGDFTTVYTGESPRNATGLLHTFSPVDANFVRLVALDNWSDANRVRVDLFKVFNTSDDNVASLAGGASIAAFSSVEKDPLLFRPCFALRVLPDESVIMACRREIVRVDPTGTSLLLNVPGSVVNLQSNDYLFALNIDPDGESFWTVTLFEGQVYKLDINTGEILLTYPSLRRGPRVSGVAVFGEPTAAVNDPPVAEHQELSTNDNVALPITLTGSDPEDDSLSFEVLTQPSNGVLTGIAPDLVYTPDFDFVGPDSFTFRVNDGEFNSPPATISIDVVLVNSPPVANAGEAYVAIANNVVALDGSGSYDPDADDVIVSFEWDLDDDGEFDDSTVVSPDITFTMTGEFIVSLRVTDNHGAVGIDETTVLVSGDTPVVEAGDDQDVAPGETVNLDPATFTDTGLADTHTATIEWGDGVIEPGDVTQDAGSGTVDGSHVYAGGGSFTVYVCVTDNSDFTGCDSLVVTIEGAPPVANAGGPYVVDEGSSMALDGSGSSDADGSIVLYEWDLDEDGVFGETGLDAANGDETGVSPLFTAAAIDGPASITVTLRVTDDSAGSDEAQASVDVENVAPTGTLSNDGPVDEGSQASVNFSDSFDASAADTADGLLYSFDFGDDGSFEVVDSIVPTEIVPLSLTSDGPTVIPVRGRISDKDGGFSEYVTEIEVLNVAPSVSATGDSVIEGDTATVEVSFTDPGTLDTHAATIDWGDGSDLEDLGAVTSPFSPTHIYAEEGTFTVIVTVTDNDGGSGQATADVEVTGLLPPTANAGGPYGVDEGASVTLDGSGSSDADGSIVLYEWDLDEDGVFGETGLDAANGDETGVGPTFGAALIDGPSTVSVALRVTDNDGLSDTQTSQVNVNNVAPTADVSGDTIDEGSSATVGISFNDPGSADTHSVSVDWGDSSQVQVINPATSPLNPSHVYTDNGSYTVTVTVTDDDGGIGTTTAEVNVSNVAPTADLGNDGPVNEGSQASVTFSSQFDPSSDDSAAGFTYSYDFGNDGAFEVSGSAVPTELVPLSLTSAGPALIDVRGRIEDKDGGFTDLFTTIEVLNVAPAVTATGNTVTLGEQATVDITFTDPDLSDTHTASIDWGDGTGPEPVSPASSPFDVTHTYASADTFTVTVTVIDDDGGEGEAQATVQVLPLDLVPPVADAGGPYAVDEGSSVALDGSVSSDADGSIVLYEWDLDEDGVFGETGLDAANGDETGVEPIFSTALLDGPSAVSVALRVTDNDGLIDTQTSQVNVNNVAPAAELGNDGPVDEGSQSSVSFSGAFEPSADDVAAGLLYSFDFGDDGSFEITDSPVPTELVPLSLTSDGPAVIPVRGVISDKDGGSNDYLTEIVVLNVAPVVSATGDTVQQGDAATVSVTFNDPGTPDTHVATIDWGDGSDAEGLGAVTSPFSPTHVYSSPGAYTVTVTVTDDDGGTGQAMATVVVTELLPPVADAGGPYAVDEGSSVSLDGSGSSDADGSIVLYEWDLDEDGVFGETGADAANGDETGVSPLFSAVLLDGPSAVSVALRVTDNDGLSDTQTSQVNLNNVAPSVSTTGDTVTLGDPATVSVSFTDPGVPDTHTALIDWGDGTEPEPVSPVTSSFSPTHTYPSADTFTVTVTVIDDDEGAGQAQTVVVVNTPAEPEADLSITKTDSADPVVTGDVFSYTVTVSNAGPGTAEAVTITDTLPAGLTFTSSGVCTEAAGAVTCELGDLAPGASATVTVEVTAGEQGTYTNTASVSSTTTDPDVQNNSASEDTTVMGIVEPPTCDTQVSFVVDFDSVVSLRDPVEGGPEGTFYFIAVLTNTGDYDLVDVTAVVTILTNGNLLLEADGGPGGVGTIYTIPLTGDYADGTLSPGETVLVPHTIGLAELATFEFFVDIACSVTTAVEEVPS